jgi:hypothetical protein
MTGKIAISGAADRKAALPAGSRSSMVRGCLISGTKLPSDTAARGRVSVSRTLAMCSMICPRSLTRSTSGIKRSTRCGSASIYSALHWGRSPQASTDQLRQARPPRVARARRVIHSPSSHRRDVKTGGIGRCFQGSASTADSLASGTLRTCERRSCQRRALRCGPSLGTARTTASGFPSLGPF